MFFCKKEKGTATEWKDAGKQRIVLHIDIVCVEAMHTYGIWAFNFISSQNLSSFRNCDFSLFICILTMSRSWNKKNESEYRNTFPPSCVCERNGWRRKKQTKFHSLKWSKITIANGKQMFGAQCSMLSQCSVFGLVNCNDFHFDFNIINIYMFRIVFFCFFFFSVCMCVAVSPAECSVFIYVYIGLVLIKLMQRNENKRRFC